VAKTATAIDDNVQQKPFNLDAAASEVMAGLPNEQGRLAEAILNQQYYDCENETLIPRRPAETDRDYEDRPKRTLDLTRQGIDALCSNQYRPPPARKLEGGSGVDTWLQGVYADQLVDAKFQQAERLATTNTVCGIQIVATGDLDRPIKYVLWGGEELAVWTDPEDATKAVAVCTIDRQDCQTRYKLWSDSEVRVYITKKLESGQTSGGRTATEISRTPHAYGCLPFVFVHYELPDRKFWTGSPGETLRRANARVDVRLSELDEAIEKFNLRPLVLAWGVDPNWRPVYRAGAVNHVPRTSTGDLGGESSVNDSGVEVKQIAVDPAAIWADVTEFIYMKLEGVGVPRSAVRVEPMSASSGIQIIAEQAPLLTRAQNRRAMFRVYETELAKVTLTCAGNHYGKPDLTKAAKDVRLSLLWPEPFIPIPDTTRDQIDQAGIDMGVKSAVDVCMERYGMTREQAMERLRQVAEDNKFMASIHPQPAVDSTSAGSGALDEESAMKGEGQSQNQQTESGPADVAQSDKPDDAKGK
jgi:hypothetical protein